MNNDPQAYLHRMGLPKGVSKRMEQNAKAQETGRVAVKAHTRAMAISKPDKNDRAPGTSCDVIGVSGSTHGEGSLGSKPEGGKGLAKRANIEGNESAHYEKLEKKSLRSMKQGGSEKELRQGHNDGGQLPYPKGKKSDAKIEKTMHEFKEGGLHSGSKKGPKVTNRKQAVAIALSQARKAK
jgi:uncharacterized protein DUF6496